MDDLFKNLEEKLIKLNPRDMAFETDQLLYDVVNFKDFVPSSLVLDMTKSYGDIAKFLEFGDSHILRNSFNGQFYGEVDDLNQDDYYMLANKFPGYFILQKEVKGLSERVFYLDSRPILFREDYILDDIRSKGKADKISTSLASKGIRFLSMDFTDGFLLKSNTLETGKLKGLVYSDFTDVFELYSYINKKLK